MKHQTTYGVIETERGRVAVKHPAIAQALSEANDRITTLGRALVTHREGLDRQGVELNERTLALAALQNHWWVRLGEALGIVRRDG